MYLFDQVKGALEGLRTLEEDMVGKMHAQKDRFCVFKPTCDIRRVDKVCAVKADDKLSLGLTEVVLA